MNKLDKRIVYDLAEELGISSILLHDENVQNGLEDYLAGYSDTLLASAVGGDPQDYKDLLQFLAIPLKRMRKDDLTAHLSCRKECTELMMLQGEINSRTKCINGSNSMTRDEFDKYASALEMLVARISRIPKYAAWAREMQKAISEALLNNGRA